MLHDRHDPKLLDQIIGKTVESTEYGLPVTDAQIVIRFTDGTSLTLTSWDYEGYSSGIYITERGDDE